MSHYIDGFVFPIAKEHLDEYKKIAEEVAEIWKEYGAIAYHEYLGDDLHFEGTGSFTESMDTKENELVIFGWVVFNSKDERDQANAKVPADQRMKDLVAPLLDPSTMIFNSNRMLYGGFTPLVAQ